MTRIKICGLFREQDIAFARDAAPDYVGFILNFPPSHRNLSPERAAELRAGLPPEIRAVGVFVDRPLDEVAAAAARIRLDAVQLHGREDDAYIDALRAAAALPVWKAFRVRSKEDLAAAADSAADEILLDNGYGTGEAFDWRLAGGFRRPFILAGGLTPEMIPGAVAALRPKTIDISSGVETERIKDRNKMIAAVRAARQASIPKER
ncbi:MAG: phosphoribosylanthranilate isomerase [Thermoguttaceae bacterium]|nr:phosphoribosylanthranilate isomerase [Thermoguttaceae bacterium]